MLPARRHATRRCGASRQRCAKSSRTHDEIWRLSATAAPLPMQARLSYSARLLLMRPRCGGSSPWRFMKQKRARHRRRRLWLGQRGRMRRVQKLCSRQRQGRWWLQKKLPSVRRPSLLTPSLPLSRFSL